MGTQPLSQGSEVDVVFPEALAEVLCLPVVLQKAIRCSSWTWWATLYLTSEQSSAPTKWSKLGEPAELMKAPRYETELILGKMIGEVAVAQHLCWANHITRSHVMPRQVIRRGV